MIAVNELSDCPSVSRASLRPLAVLLSPLAPHLAETLWTESGGSGLVIDADWPNAEERWLVDDEIEMPVSFNGKVRFKLKVATDLNPNEVEQIARSDDRTAKHIGEATIRKVIVVPGRIVNIVFG